MFIAVKYNKSSEVILLDKDIDYEALGGRIRTARKAKNFSQEKLGELCQLSTAHVGHIERGTRIPSLETLFRISKELDVSLDYLLFDSQNDINALFKSISVQLTGKDRKKINTFITVVKALADKIDEL